MSGDLPRPIKGDSLHHPHAYTTSNNNINTNNTQFYSPYAYATPATHPHLPHPFSHPLSSTSGPSGLTPPTRPEFAVPTLPLRNRGLVPHNIGSLGSGSSSPVSTVTAPATVTSHSNSNSKRGRRPYAAARSIPNNGKNWIMRDGRQYGRNALIAEEIFRLTGQSRTRQQISSHIQVLKKVHADDPMMMKILNGQLDELNPGATTRSAPASSAVSPANRFGSNSASPPNIKTEDPGSSVSPPPMVNTDPIEHLMDGQPFISVITRSSAPASVTSDASLPGTPQSPPSTSHSDTTKRQVQIAELLPRTDIPTVPISRVLSEPLAADRPEVIHPRAWRGERLAYITAITIWAEKTLKDEGVRSRPTTTHVFAQMHSATCPLEPLPADMEDIVRQIQPGTCMHAEIGIALPPPGVHVGKIRATLVVEAMKEFDGYCLTDAFCGREGRFMSTHTTVFPTGREAREKYSWIYEIPYAPEVWRKVLKGNPEGVHGVRLVQKYVRSLAGGNRDGDLNVPLLVVHDIKVVPTGETGYSKIKHVDLTGEQAQHDALGVSVVGADDDSDESIRDGAADGDGDVSMNDGADSKPAKPNLSVAIPSPPEDATQQLHTRVNQLAGRRGHQGSQPVTPFEQLVHTPQYPPPFAERQEARREWWAPTPLEGPGDVKISLEDQMNGILGHALGDGGSRMNWLTRDALAAGTPTLSDFAGREQQGLDTPVRIEHNTGYFSMPYAGPLFTLSTQHSHCHHSCHSPDSPHWVNMASSPAIHETTGHSRDETTIVDSATTATTNSPATHVINAHISSIGTSQRLSMPPPAAPTLSRPMPTMTIPTPAARSQSQSQSQPQPQALVSVREFPPPGVSIAPDDLKDTILMGICRALAHVENRALTPRQIVDVAHSAGIIKLGGNTPASTVSTHIRAHLARGTPVLLLRHSLHPRPRHPSDTPTTEDRAIGPNPDGSSERKKGTAWYLSEAAGFLSPWDRLSIPKPKEPDSDPSARASPSPAPPAPIPTPVPFEPQSQPQRMSSRKRTRTKSWGAAARELGLDGMTPSPEFDDESEAEAHRERKSKVRIRLRLGSVASRSSPARPDDAPSSPTQGNYDDSDVDEDPQCSNPFPIRDRVFSAPCPQLTHSRRSLSNPSSGGPSTPHALEHAEDSDVEDGDFHVQMMCNSDSAPSSPCRPADQVPIVGIGLGLIFEGSDRRVRVKEESESPISPPSLSSRASSLAASSLPEDDVWAVKIEETEDVKMAMAVDVPPFDPPDLCEGGLGFDFTTSCEGIELEFAMLGVRSPTILPNAFIRETDHVGGPESVHLDEVDRLWSDWGDKRAHTRSLRTARNSPSKRRDLACGWGCRAAPGMRVSLGGPRSRPCDERTATSGVVLQREREFKIDKTVLHGVEYASYVIRGCILLRRLEDAYVSLSALLRACRVPGSCHAQFRTNNTIDISSPPPGTSEVSNAADGTAPTTAPALVAEPSDVLHNNSSSDVVNPAAMPQGASIDFGTGVEAADVSGMWCPLAEARSVAEERLRPYLPEDVRAIFLGDTLVLNDPEPESELEPTPEVEVETKMDIDPETVESKSDETPDVESKTDADECDRRDNTPVAPITTREKVLAASEEDVSVFMRPSSPAAVPCASVRRVLRTRPARVVRTRTRA
ncbi:hypothetical protein RHS04_02495 [Rhizoctonia solani]|uniref:TEA domain-containing protein n=1 Tax=Rhizoctonia solani TaxID=456999 RepID=A0A8H7LL07_9AGAM|nr:hypothetical protein RHS04_02495 [Rhizoctonia solani]